MSKKRARTQPAKQSEAVYTHRGPTNTRDLGSNLNHDHCTIPSVNFRTLEQSIPRDQLRTHTEYRGYNPRTGKSKYAQVPDDLLAHAVSSITDAKFCNVTTGYRQRYEQEESKREIKDKGDNPAMYIGPTAAPSPLSGGMSRRRKDRY